MTEPLYNIWYQDSLRGPWTKLDRNLTEKEVNKQYWVRWHEHKDNHLTRLRVLPKGETPQKQLTNLHKWLLSFDRAR